MRTARIRVRPKLTVVEDQLPLKDEGFTCLVKSLYDVAEDYGVKSFGYVIEHTDGSTSSSFSIGRSGSAVKLLGACQRLSSKLNNFLDNV